MRSCRLKGMGRAVARFATSISVRGGQRAVLARLSTFREEPLALFGRKGAKGVEQRFRCVRIARSDGAERCAGRGYFIMYTIR